MPDLLIDPPTELEARRMANQIADHARIGAELAKFKRGKVYGWLLAEAEADAMVAVRAFRDCDPTDHRAVAALQVQAGRADDFRAWVDRMIERGEAADAALRELAA